MEEIEMEEIEEPEQNSLGEIFNASPCPKCGSDHTYVDDNNPSHNLIRCHADGCGHEWSLVEEMK
jgi:hypothetical protein